MLNIKLKLNNICLKISGHCGPQNKREIRNIFFENLGSTNCKPILCFWLIFNLKIGSHTTEAKLFLTSKKSQCLMDQLWGGVRVKLYTGFH